MAKTVQHNSYNQMTGFSREPVYHSYQQRRDHIDNFTYTAKGLYCLGWKKEFVQNFIIKAKILAKILGCQS